MRRAREAHAVDASDTALAASMERAGLSGARLAIVLGSGLGALAERVRDARAVPFTELDGMPQSTVPGHAGRFVIGDLAGERVLLQQGRVHLYEGCAPVAVTRSMRACAAIGCSAVLLTNAAGCLRREWKPGSFVRIVDHVNMQGRSSLFGEPRAPFAYDTPLGEALDRAAASVGVALHAGVYAGVLGPSYETPAEIRMLAWLGADAVGMSTVAEAVAARAAGARVAALSCLTNYAAGISSKPLSHDEVLDVGRASARSFGDVIEAAVPRMCAELTRRGTR